MRKQWKSLVSILALVGLGLSLAPGCGRGKAEPGDGSSQIYDARGQRIHQGPTLENPPNLIVLVVDALRGDAVGGETPRMPFLASLADEGVRLDQVAASAPWTLPSMLSLFTGLRPSKHGQYRVEDRWHLPGAVTTLPEVLKSGYGYETAAFVNGTWFQQSKASLLQGFQKRETLFSLQDLDGTVGRWNERRDRDKPFFLLLHTFDVHEPYGEANHPWPPILDHEPRVDPTLLAEDTDPADIFRACFLDADAGIALHRDMGPRLSDMLQRYKFRGYAESPRPELARELAQAYWDGARWADGLLEAAHAKLEAWGMLDNTLLVVTSDHGEAFGEHGNLAHSLFLYDEVIRVPMVMKGPGPFQGGRVVDASVGLFDLLPTFLDWIEAPPLAGIDARSFLPVLEGQVEGWCRPVISEERLTRASTGENRNAIRVSARNDAWKYIVTFDLHTGEVREEAYNLRVDPEERHDLGEETGTLPGGKLFDACVCAAVEELRQLIWQEPNEQGEVHTTPYGAGPLRARTPRPTPCESTP